MSVFHHYYFLSFFLQIFKLGSSVAFVFFVTLAAFPSLTSRIRSKHEDNGSEWTSKKITVIKKCDWYIFKEQHKIIDS